MLFTLRRYKKILITLFVVVVAAASAHQLWFHYLEAPWTRDGRIRADVVNIAPDVSGLVIKVAITDNQYVHQGDILFEIDPEHYRHALAQAESDLAEKKADLQLKQSQLLRRQKVDDKVVSGEEKQNLQLQVLSSEARYQAALAALNQAKLNLERTHVRSPVDGWISNLLLRPGDFAHSGTAEVAVIDQHSFWVYGYFEENKIRHIHLGDKAEMSLLDSSQTLYGRVESIAHGIADRDNPTGSRLLANVNPSFNWVRLAQRVPVRIKLDNIPSDIHLVAGMTCTVVIQPTNTHKDSH